MYGLNDLLMIALCGALLFLLVVWMLFGAICFSKASAEVKRDIPETPEESVSRMSIGLINCAVDHLQWKRQRGYLWGGGYKYDE